MTTPAESSRRRARNLPISILVFGLTLHLGAGRIAAGDGPDLRNILKDKNSRGSDLWIYNDIAAAMDGARKQNKPLFVTFRCVPCKVCAGFDASVAGGDGRVQKLARKESNELINLVVRDLDDHAGDAPQHDDMTLVTVRVTG